MIEEDKTLVTNTDTRVAAEGPQIAQDLVIAFQQIGFELIRPLGSGGMAEVFLAVETELGRRVAIKVMRDELTSSEELRIRFVEEAQRAAKLEHKNILTLFRAGTLGKLRFIVMQLATEGDLAERLKLRAIEPAAASALVVQLASAIAYAHGQGIVHRDIKPANVFFNKDEEPILADFGIAKSLIDPSRTQVGSIIGTPRYMSPEQAAGLEVDAKTDIYALGLVFFEMLTRRLPESRNDLKKIRNALPVEARNFAELILKCLSTERAARPSAAEFASILADKTKVVRRSPLLLASLSVVAAVTVFAAIYLGSDADRPVEVNLKLEPTDTRVFLNGQEVLSRPLEMSEDSGEVALIKRGHVGQLLPIEAAQGLLSASLPRLSLPSAAEKQRFHARFDDESLRSEQLSFEDLSNPVYRDLIRLKQRQLAGESMESEWARLRTLARLGDDASALKLFLAASVSPPLLSDDRDVARSWVANASNGDAEYPGYALASYYRALGIIQERGLEEFTARDRAVVRDLLARSYFQGLNWPDDNMAWYLTMACDVPLVSTRDESLDADTAACVAAMPTALPACLNTDAKVSTPETLLLCLRSAGVPI